MSSSATIEDMSTPHGHRPVLVSRRPPDGSTTVQPQLSPRRDPKTAGTICTGSGEPDPKVQLKHVEPLAERRHPARRAPPTLTANTGSRTGPTRPLVQEHGAVSASRHLLTVVAQNAPTRTRTESPAWSTYRHLGVNRLSRSCSVVVCCPAEGGQSMPPAERAQAFPAARLATLSPMSTTGRMS